MTGPDNPKPLVNNTSVRLESPTNAGRLLSSPAVIAGLLAGLTAWAIGEATHGLFGPPMSKYEMMGQTLYRATFEDQLSADARKATLAYCVLGGSIGLSLGLAGGLSRHSIRDAIKAGILGLFLGVLTSFVASIGMIPVYNRALEKSPEAMSHDLT